MSLLLLLACAGGPPPAVHPADPLPASAPGLHLLATLEADGDVAVGGTLLTEAWVDLDSAEDTRDGFRYVLTDAAGEALYARSTPGPLIVRDFLAYYGAQSGYSLLDLLPELGRFPLLVPRLDGAERVRLEVRQADGSYAEVGDYTLADAEADDVGVSDAPVGWETLYESGPPEGRLDLVIVGDGYTEAEQDRWRADAAAVAEELLSTPPFSDHASRLNLHRVDVISAESGVSYDCTDVCGMRDTALGTVFPLEVVNAVTGTDYRTSAVFQLDQWEVARVASVAPWDFVLVVANTSHEGGFAVHFATVTNQTDAWTAVAVHELGHLLGLLGDEYDVDDCIRSDALGLPVNVTDTPEEPPWSAWIEEGTPLPTPDDREWRDVVGAFAPAYNCEDLYRPARSCRMESSRGVPFCAVCSEQLVRRLFRYGDPADGVEVSVGASGAPTLTVHGLDPEAEVSWWLDGAILGERSERLTLGRDLVPGGTHTLRVDATLASPLVRTDPDGDLTQSWSFRVE